MALPVAPLGSLPNLHVPTHMQMYEKPRGTLDKALEAFLVGVARQAGGQVIENAMSRDYSDKPAGFLERLASGPRKGEALHRQEQAQEHQTALSQAELDNAIARQASSQDAAFRAQTAEAAEQELGRADTARSARSLEELRQRGDLARDTANITARAEAERAAQEDRQLADWLAQQSRETHDLAMLQGQLAGQRVASDRDFVGKRLLEQERAINEAASPSGQYAAEQAKTAKSQREHQDRIIEEQRNKGKKPAKQSSIDAAKGKGGPGAPGVTAAAAPSQDALQQFLAAQGLDPAALQRSQQAQAATQAQRQQEAAEQTRRDQQVEMFEYIRLNNPDLYRQLVTPQFNLGDVLR